MAWLDGLPYSKVTINGCLISARMSLSIFVRTLSRTAMEVCVDRSCDFIATHI